MLTAFISSLRITFEPLSEGKAKERKNAHTEPRLACQTTPSSGARFVGARSFRRSWLYKELEVVRCRRSETQLTATISPRFEREIPIINLPIYLIAEIFHSVARNEVVPSVDLRVNVDD